MDHDATLLPATPPGRGREQVIGDGIAWTARWSGRWILIALGAVLVGLLVQQLWSILLPVLLAMIIATVLQAPARLLERRLHLPPAAAAGAVLLGSIAAIVGIAAAIAPSVKGQTGDIADDATEGLQKLQDWLQKSDLVTATQLDSAVQAAQDKLNSSADTIASGVLSGVSAVSSAAITLLLTLVLTFFFLKDGRHLAPWVGRLAGRRVGPHLREVMTRSWTTLGGYIRTQALVSLIDAVVIGAGLLLVGVPLAIPLTILTFAGGFIPIVGAVVVGAIAVLVALVSNGVTGALIILAVILAVQQLEGNVLSPWLQAKSMQLHAVVVLLSVTLGSTLFGIVGAFLAVPVVAVAAVVLRYLDEQVSRVDLALPPEG
jgi:predicted PurR-regulated permease PerM